MRPAEAEALAARVRAEIARARVSPFRWPNHAQLDADQERVASDLAGLQLHAPLEDNRHHPWCGYCESQDWPCLDATRYADGLRRTAALYGAH